MNMKKCDKGHFYADNLEICPYCSPDSKNPSSFISNLNKTVIITPESKNINSSTNSNSPNMNTSQPTANVGRKLVGWLVSFTHNPLGEDFKLYEGKNIIGSDKSCDIVITDNLVSSKHLTILFRADKFKFKDELSTNGTFINEVMQDEGDLKDGDQIRIGKTVFKFRSIN